MSDRHREIEPLFGALHATEMEPADPKPPRRANEPSRWLVVTLVVAATVLAFVVWRQAF